MIINIQKIIIIIHLLVKIINIRMKNKLNLTKQHTLISIVYLMKNKMMSVIVIILLHFINYLNKIKITIK